MKSLHFRFLRFPIEVHPIAWIVLGFILLSRASGGPSALLGGVVLAVVLFVSILVHELGHGLVARGFHLGPVQITIHGFGGLTTHRRSPSPGRSMLVTAAGPAAGLLREASATPWTSACRGHPTRPRPPYAPPSCAL